MRIYFIYYKVDLAQAAEAAASVNAALADIERTAGIRGRLMRRTDEPSTWMEVYDSVSSPETLERAIEAAVKEHALERFLKSGTRRMFEKFQPLESSAPA